MKRILFWFAIGIVALLVILVSLPFLIDANRFRPLLETNLTRALTREVRLGELKLALLAGGITASDLSIAEDPVFGKPAFLRAKQLKVAVDLLPLILSRQLNVTGITIDEPEIVLVQTPTGAWNFSSIGGKPAGRAAPSPAGSSPTGNVGLTVKLIGVTNGRLTFSRTGGHWKPLVLEQVKAEIHDFSNDSSFPFSMNITVAGGGTIALIGTAGPINATDAALTPVSAKVKITNLDLAASGVNDWAPTLAGLVSLDGDVKSDGLHGHVTGKVKVDRLKLAKNATPARNPVEFDFDVDNDLRRHAGRLNRGNIHIGKAVASFTGTYAEQGEAVVLNMNLVGSNMPVPDLAAMLPAMAISLPAGSSLEGGTASARLAMQGPADRLVSSGTLAINGTRLSGFDLGKKMSVMERLAGLKSGANTEIETLSANVRDAPDGATINDLKLVATSIGELNGNGTISPANALAFKMTAVAHAGGIAAVVNNAPIPFTIEGTTTDPVFRPDMKGIAKEQLENLGGDAGKAAEGIIKGFFGGKKKN